MPLLHFTIDPQRTFDILVVQMIVHFFIFITVSLFAGVISVNSYLGFIIFVITLSVFF